jgi:hypothetical protein
MRHAIRLTLLAGTALACASCGANGVFNYRPGHSAEFIAGNPTSVLIDFAHGSDRELDAARILAVNRCTLFGRTAAVLDSINPRSNGMDRASYLCQ